MDNVKQAKEKTIEVDLFIRDTGPLTDEEFDDMMAHDNDDISIEELNFEIFNT
jgi:predicted nucleotidyltransferase